MNPERHEPPAAVPEKPRGPAWRRLFGVGKAAFAGWWADNIPRMGAALAYYTLFALAPVLIVAIAIGGLVWGADAVRGEIVGQIGGLMGQEGAQTVEDMLAAASQQRPGFLVMLSGIVTFIAGATGAFLEKVTIPESITR